MTFKEIGRSSLGEHIRGGKIGGRMWHKWGEEANAHVGTEKDAAHEISSIRWRHAIWGFDMKLADTCENGELLEAAFAYLCYPSDGLWPFHPEGFFPSDPEDNLVWAAAYLAAESDRIRRARLAGKVVSSGLVMLSTPPERLEHCVEGLRTVRQQMEEIEERLTG